MTVSIRKVTVELLRKGPAHNQLLSPLTEYLGIAGESGAGSVTIPYEQANFNRLVSDLRYGDADEDDQVPRLTALRTLGRDLGEVLGRVPGLAGSLTEADLDSLLNLQFLTSASELSLLPFELAKMPSGTGRSIDDYLALSSAARICITRRIRSVDPSLTHWPAHKQPRILFVVGLDIDESLRDQHRRILLDALRPFKGELVELAPDFEEQDLRPNQERDAALTGVSTAIGIRDALAEDYPYVHILAHGAESPATEVPTVGLLLPGPKYQTLRDSEEEDTDILTGDRFASILRSLPVGVERPSSVLVASCESAAQGNVIAPGGSFAQSLHAAGTSLVVASQFPLYVDASTSLTEEFYPATLWGYHPLETLAKARAKLHSQFAYTHDWASLVVYDALPLDLEQQLGEVQYQRARQALTLAQKEIADCAEQREQDPRTADRARRAREVAQTAIDRFPEPDAHPDYQRECEGLRASHEKQMAEVEYKLAARDETPEEEAEEGFAKVRQRLTDALVLYRRAARRFLLLKREPQQQRYATLHWVQIQAISVSRVLGGDSDPGEWWTGYRSAEIELEHTDEPYWAHGSLAELWLLKLFEGAEQLSESEREAAAAKAVEHAAAIRRIVSPSHFAVFSTKRQLDRYRLWWGTPEFSQRLGLERSERWDGKLGVLEVADRMVRALTE